TLENTFVSLLRGLGDERAAPPLPGGQVTVADHGAVAIGARGLSRQYGDFIAVRGVSLAVRYGEIYGLLGANGAGKTTTIKMLCGLVAPSAGQTELAGGGRGARPPARPRPPRPPRPPSPPPRPPPDPPT